MFCENGWAVDEKSGCEICACRDSPKDICKNECSKNQKCDNGRCICEPVQCRIFCEHGWVVDARDGCEICDCKVSTCEDLTCSKNEHCEESITCKGSNCPPSIPKCIENKCSPVQCRMFCEYGWAVDAKNGCEICACKKPTCQDFKCAKNEYCKETITCKGLNCPPSIPKCQQCPPSQCYAQCQPGYSFEKNEMGCSTCNCIPDVTDRALLSDLCAAVTCIRGQICDEGDCKCPQNDCKLFCGHGLKTDETNGCQLCECYLPAVKPTRVINCKNTQECPSGFTCKFFDKKCTGLMCSESYTACVETCKVPKCHNQCESNVWRKTPEGCQTCECVNDAKELRNQDQCDIFDCAGLDCGTRGFQNDRKGCPVCSCRAHPLTKCTDSRCKAHEKCMRKIVNKNGSTSLKTFCYFKWGPIKRERALD